MKQYALVTGGSRNIGASISSLLTRQGIDVIVADLIKPEHSDLAEFVEVDLTDPVASAEKVKKVIADRPVTRFIHNAGMGRFGLIQDVDLADVNAMFNVSVASLVSLAQIVVPSMRDGHFGRIVAIGSGAARGREGRTGYAASKAALSGVVRTWGLELGRDGITVNMISPGPIRTSLFDYGNPPDHPKTIAMVAAIPVGRIGLPEDVGHAVAFLCSEHAGFITGQDIPVCGGSSIRGSPAPGRTN
jgi:NAD(P)-dependent dehydrogenase (short-subunit alcohol dehydrogenase family)